MAFTKKFNGKIYHFQSQYHNWGRANAHAERLRKKGHLARVVEIDILTWEVYAR